MAFFPITFPPWCCHQIVIALQILVRKVRTLVDVDHLRPPPRPKVNPPMAHLGIFLSHMDILEHHFMCKGPFHWPAPTPESRKKPLNYLPTGRIKLAQQASVTSITPLAHRREVQLNKWKWPFFESSSQGLGPAELENFRLGERED